MTEESTRQRPVGPAETPTGTRFPVPGGEDDFSVFADLAAVLERAIAVLKTQADCRPADAFLLVAAADEALGRTPSLLEALAPVIDAARPGPFITDELNRYRAELTRLVDLLRPLRAELAGLRESRHRWESLAAEHDSIVAEIAELRDLERLAEPLAELRAQQETLRERAKDLSRLLADPQSELASDGRSLIRLSQQVQRVIRKDTRDVLKDVAEQDQALRKQITDRHIAHEHAKAQLQGVKDRRSALDAEVADAEAEEKEAKRELEQAAKAANQRVTRLRRYAAADRAISIALSGPPADSDGQESSLAAVGAADLDDIESKLAAIDAELAKRLTELRRRRQLSRGPRRPTPVDPDQASLTKE